MSTKEIKVFFYFVSYQSQYRRALNKSLKINSIFIYLSIFPWPQICVLEFQTFVLNSQHQGDANFVKFELHFSTLPLALLEIFSFQLPIKNIFIFNKFHEKHFLWNWFHEILMNLLWLPQRDLISGEPHHKQYQIDPNPKLHQGKFGRLLKYLFLPCQVVQECYKNLGIYFQRENSNIFILDMLDIFILPMRIIFGSCHRGIGIWGTLSNRHESLPKCNFPLFS